MKTVRTTASLFTSIPYWNSSKFRFFRIAASSSVSVPSLARNRTEPPPARYCLIASNSRASKRSRGEAKTTHEARARFSSVIASRLSTTLYCDFSLRAAFRKPLFTPWVSRLQLLNISTGTPLREPRPPPELEPRVLLKSAVFDDGASPAKSAITSDDPPRTRRRPPREGRSSIPVSKQRVHESREM